MANLLNICVAIICYCVALLVAVERKRVFDGVRRLCSNAVRLIPVLSCLLTIVVLNACGGSADDHTGENWIFAIFLIAAAVRCGWF